MLVADGWVTATFPLTTLGAVGKLCAEAGAGTSWVQPTSQAEVANAYPAATRRRDTTDTKRPLKTPYKQSFCERLIVNKVLLAFGRYNNANPKLSARRLIAGSSIHGPDNLMSMTMHRFH
jgi:hypothetical protein